MPVTAGTLQLSGQAQISGAEINPQGTATVTQTKPSASANGVAGQLVEFGTGSNQSDIYCAGDFSLTSGASVTFDLLTGTDFKDVFNQTAAFAKLKSLFVSILSGGDTAGVVIGNAASNQLGLWFSAVTNTWTIYPSGPPMMGGQPAGLTVDATHRNIKITNAGAVTAVVRVILAGSSV